MSQIASSVNFQQEARVQRKIPVGAVMTLASLGITERGPIGETTLIFDWPDWQRVYGGYNANGNAAIAAELYFLNGGTRLRQSRVVHCTTSSDPTTKTSTAGTKMLTTSALAAIKGSVTGTAIEPFDLASGDTLKAKVDGGGELTATFTGTAAARENTPAEPYALANGNTLTVKIDAEAVAQSIAFLTAEFVNIAAATAEEVAAVINAKIVGAQSTATAGGTKVTITSDTLGTGSHVEVTGGTANAVLLFNVAQVNGTGNVVDIDAVTAAEVKTVFELAVAGTTVSSVAGKVKIETNTSGAGGSIQVTAAATADDEMGLDNAVHAGSDAGTYNTLKVDAKTDGSWSGEITIRIEASTSTDTDEFKLTVLRNGLAVETWDNLSMTDADANYCETVLNNEDTGSNYIVVTDQAAAVNSPDDLPAAGTSAAMSTGGDGLAALADTDFNGGTSANGKVGLRTFDLDSDIDVIISPDRATSSHHNAMVTYCDITREGRLFALLDPPANTIATAMATYIKTTAALFSLTENGAIYWPRIKIDNPDMGVFGADTKITVPPSGMIAGVYSRTDASKIGGVFDQPAGLDKQYLPVASGLELDTDEVRDINKRGLLFELNCNLISQEEGTPIFIDGARNLDITGNWTSIGAARGIIFVQKKLAPALAFLRHRNLSPKVYNRGYMTVDDFLSALEVEGAFERHSVDFGEALNTAAVQAQRRIKARIGIKQWGVGEFVDVLIGPDNDDLESQLVA